MTTNKKLYLHKILTSVIGCMFVIYNASAANVSARGAQRATQAAARAIAQKSTAKTSQTTTQKTETKKEPEIIIESKSSQFDDILSGIKEIKDISENQDLAEKIKKQREALNTQANKEITSEKTKKALATGQNDCDQKLRACMKTKCGEDFTKCAGDTDTIWGDKLDLCRQNITCTGTEYNLFTKEIKADRDLNQQLAGYKSIVDCGNRYNDCIITQCGTTFTNCLGKSAGDTAIKKCEKIANECKQQDSGMPARVAEAMGNLRTNAEELVARDEQRLYDLRDQMRETCGRLGALFDDRTLDCIYSINFYGGESGDLMASKKAYAGTSFNCDADWFGIDVTTFMENAARLTKSTKSATSAALGAGVGVGVGAVTSGAIGRAIDTAKAKKELKAAEKEATAYEETQEITPENNELSSEQGGVNNTTKNNELNNTATATDLNTPRQIDIVNAGYTPQTNKAMLNAIGATPTESKTKKAGYTPETNKALVKSTGAIPTESKLKLEKTDFSAESLFKGGLNNTSTNSLTTPRTLNFPTQN